MDYFNNLLKEQDCKINELIKTNINKDLAIKEYEEVIPGFYVTVTVNVSVTPTKAVFVVNMSTTFIGAPVDETPVPKV